MKRLNFNIKDRKTLSLVLCLVLVCVFTLTVAYSALTTVLTISGNARVTAADWDIYLANPKVTSGSATTDVPVIKTSSTLEFNTTLNMPGDFYEFTVDVVNGGSLDAMIENVVKNPELTTEQAKYLNYEVSYKNGESIATKQTLPSNSSMPIKVRVEYRRDISASDLPTSQTKLDLSLTLEYVQSDGTGTSVSGNGGYLASLEGKSAIFFGDSVAYGYSTSGKGFGYYIDAIENFSNFTNAAVNTATLNTSTQGTNNVIEQIKKNVNNSYDYVVIEGGYGDLRDTPPLGSITDGYVVSEWDTTTFAGAVEYTLYLATTTWEDARIGFIISYDTPNSNYGVRPDHAATKQYWDIVKAACNKWDVEYLDFFEGSVTYNGETKTYSELFDVTGNTYLASDNIHPTATGYEFIAPFIADWMKTLSIFNRNFDIDTGTSGDDNNDNSGTSNVAPSTLTTVTSFADLVFIKDYSQSGYGNELLTPDWIEVVGRASAVNYVLEVSGGSAVGLSSSASDVTYSIAEFDSNKSIVNPSLTEGKGETHRAWVSNNITLQSSTKYITVSFKKGDGSTSFTDAELALLPTYIEFK